MATEENNLNKHLHIICLNVPYPVDYGGVFDLFYKLAALQQRGVKICLHCFDYGRGEQPMLNRFCQEVNYYKREKSITAVSIKYPFIVSSRKNKKLLSRLAEDNYPILMEGVHCTYLLNDKRFNERKCYVRLHNVEHVYYHYLYENTSSLLKKLYFLWESKILKRYESKIAKRAVFWSVTKKDAETYKELGCTSVQFLPLFIPQWKVGEITGKGCFCLYHGDLSVAENEKAAVWLVQNIFNDMQIPFVIAGKNPSKHLSNLLSKSNTACLIANPGEKEMQDLIAKAHVNIIPSYNATGIKLKLINALFNGRHCLVNEQTVEGSGLEKACYIASGANDFKEIIAKLYEQPLDVEDVVLRHQLLDEMFDNETNAKQIVEWIWGSKEEE